MIIGIPVYQKVDLLDVTGPHEMFQWMKQSRPHVDVQIIAEVAGEITSRDGFTFKATKCFEEVEALDALWVPGGDTEALKVLMNGPNSYLDFLVAMAKNARYVTSVCEGALLLAAAGLLDGYEATTHWAFVPCLKQFPKVKVVEGHPRFVVDGNRVTGGGISSGLDEALKLIELLTCYEVAQAVQRSTQYYPDPPVASTLPTADGCPFTW
jgi:cyclohexyl-isocyanide hydratase